MVKPTPILVIEDDPVQQSLIQTYLEGQGYSLTIAANASMAFEAYDAMRHVVVICDIHLPGEQSGTDILKQLMQYENPPVVVMLTSESDARSIIESMRIGAYDYVIKPTDAAELCNTIKRATDRAESERATRQAERDRIRRLDEQLATRRIAEMLIRRHNDNFVRGIFRNLHASFSQGKGVGAVSTLLSMLVDLEKTADGQNYLAPVDILDMVLENQNSIVDMLQVFLDLQLLVTGEPSIEQINLGALHTLMLSEIIGLDEKIKLEGHKVILSELPSRFSSVEIKINEEFMRKAVRELVINGLKFSPPGSTITILFEYLYSRLVITVLSVPIEGTESESGKIPEEYRTVIFEPFFRLSRVVREQYGTLEFGLGLTLVEKVVQFHQGKIRSISMQLVQTVDAPPVELVGFEIELPT